MFDKAAFLQAIKPKTASAEVAGFGPVSIKQLSVDEVDAVRAKLKADKDTDTFGLRLVTLSVVDESGACVFSDEDIPAIRAASNEAIEGLITKVLELNGYQRADAKN